MTPQEKEAAKIVGRLMRSARKQKSLTQVEVSKTLGISQAALSKYENGTLMVSAHHWSEFCRLATIPMDSLREGFLDHGRPITLRSDKYEGTFKLPRIYSQNRGSSIRSALPAIRYVHAQLGASKFGDYLESEGIDPDFLVSLDHSINIRFGLRMIRMLIEKGLLKQENMAEFVKPVSDPLSHGHLSAQYVPTQSFDTLYRALIANAPLYEVNFAYHVEDSTRDHVELSATPAAHLDPKEYLNDPVLGDFICRYRKAYFQQFASIQHDSGPVTVEETECHFHGAGRCVYKLRSIIC